jgi:hypothetical protein
MGGRLEGGIVIPVQYDTLTSVLSTLNSQLSTIEVRFSFWFASVIAELTADAKQRWRQVVSRERRRRGCAVDLSII